MNASSLSGECARRISVTFGEAAGVDMLGPSLLSREIVPHLSQPLTRRQDYDSPAVLPVAVKETKVCAPSGLSAEYAKQEYHTPRPNVQAARPETSLSERRSRLESQFFPGFAFHTQPTFKARRCSLRLRQRTRFFARQNKRRDVFHHFQRHMAQPRIIRRLRRSSAMNEQMIQIRISPQRHILVIRKRIRPSLEIRRRHLIISPTLQDQNRNFQLRSGFQRIVSAQVQPIGAVHSRA